ncbi:uncharacterized protein BJX67DRAFT_379019 [Aspergillus lucknowensis]|uniref:Zn(2)-C6 fungal-type domain-containing protein n=1 Tax=Aspergillus lucknowensis TaxID=176173 RepID=A0ABR4LY44_9EURO
MAPWIAEDYFAAPTMDPPLRGERGADDTDQIATGAAFQPPLGARLVAADGSIVSSTSPLDTVRNGQLIRVHSVQHACKFQGRSMPEQATSGVLSPTAMNDFLRNDLGLDPDPLPGLDIFPQTQTQVDVQDQASQSAPTAVLDQSAYLTLPGNSMLNGNGQNGNALTDSNQALINIDATPALSFGPSPFTAASTGPATPATPNPKAPNATKRDRTTTRRPPVARSRASRGTPSRVEKAGSRSTRTQAESLLDMQKVKLREFRDQHSDKLHGMQLVFGATQRNRGKMNEAAKKQLAKARARGSCPYCQRLKRRCEYGENPYAPCDGCMNAWTRSRLLFPCKVQATFDDLALFRSGPPIDNPEHPLMFFLHRQHLWDVSHSAVSPDIREVELTQGMGDKLRLTLSRFDPHPDDKTAYEWNTLDGPRKMEMPPYCIANMDEAIVSVAQYAKRSMRAYLSQLVKPNNPFLSLIFYFAAQSPSPFIQIALQIWCATRLTEETWRFTGPDTLDLHTITDPSNPWHGIIPVTPIMDQQLDQIVIRHVLQKRRDWLLPRLQRAIENDWNAKSRWIEIFTTFFILLHSSTIQLQQERAFATRYGMSGRYGPRGKYRDAEAQFHTARTLLANFHYNYRGALAFSLKIPESIAADERQAQVLNQLREQIPRRKNELAALRERNQYEDDMYWCHQLFVDNWQPGTGHIEELSDELAHTSIGNDDDGDDT